MWINKLFDFLFPVTCLGCGLTGKLICSACLSQIILLGQHLPPTHHVDKTMVILDYRQPLVKKAVKNLKYPPFNRKILDYLAPFLTEFLKLSPNLAKQLKHNGFILIPVPLTKRKLAWRGFNQASLIAEEIAAELNLNMDAKILRKTRSTSSQTGLDFRRRKDNVKNVFKAKKSCPANVLLVDDVLTTGATLDAAADALRQVGAKKIWAVVLAKG